jgi:hypothetical protein
MVSVSPEAFSNKGCIQSRLNLNRREQRQQRKIPSTTLLTPFSPVQNSDLFRQVTPGDPLAMGKRMSSSWSFCAKFKCVCPEGTERDLDYS